MICTRDVSGDLVGAGCPDCGHSGYAHPHVQQPGVTACVLCELLALRDQLRREVAGMGLTDVAAGR